MADPISTASGILALATFAFQSSKVLYQTVASFRSHQRTVRQLREELEALNGTLEALQQTVTDTDVDLTMLRLPLFRCGKACQDFEAVIVKSTAHSSESRTSFRDWAKLSYMGADIDGFKNMLAGYKSTIMIALGDANIRTSAVTLKVLQEYKDLISNTTVDLEEHLQEIDNKLQHISLQNFPASIEIVAEQKQMLEERASTQQCLSICAQVVAHINQLQPASFEAISSSATEPRLSSGDVEGQFSARVVTANTLKTCKENLSYTASELERHLQDVDTRLENFLVPGSEQSIEQTAEQRWVKDELASIQQCLAICSQASARAGNERTNVFEDVSMADDGHQVLVSTIGDLISAKRVTAGARSLQWMGQMSDDSLQQLSRNHGLATSKGSQSPQTNTESPFDGRYGMGIKLDATSADATKK